MYIVYMYLYYDYGIYLSKCMYIYALYSCCSDVGNSRNGVNLCKHADVQLKAAEDTGQENCHLVVYKVHVQQTYQFT